MTERTNSPYWPPNQPSRIDWVTEILRGLAERIEMAKQDEPKEDKTFFDQLKHSVHVAEQRAARPAWMKELVDEVVKQGGKESGG